MNFVKFGELMINLDRVTAIRLRQNNNDGSFRNKKDYPYVAELYNSDGKPFIVHLTAKMASEFSRLIASKELDGGRG